MSISSETKFLLSQSSTATIQSQLFARGFRNQFLNGVLLRTPSNSNFVGEAFTLRFIPAREDLDVLESFKDPRHPQRLAVETIGPGQVMVVDSRGDTRAASAGEILMTRIAVRGGVGFITDGSVRDSFQMNKIGIPVYSSGISANTNLVHHHAVDFQVPIGCAGVAVFPGDVVVGDEEGVLVIPRDLADEVAVAASGQHDFEEFILEKVRNGAALPGTYPPSVSVREEYLKSTRKKD
jgi:regulator of RNase E activity RraA